MKRTRIKLIVIGLALGFVFQQQVEAQIVISKSVFGNGGDLIDNNNNRLNSTAGQAAIGVMSNSNNTMLVGFWYVVTRLPNTSPMADAGPDDTVECATHNGTPVTLDATGSTDPDPLSYTWTGPFPEGGGAATGPTPTVTLALGAHTITLTVEDPSGETDTDEVEITVEDTTPPEVMAAFLLASGSSDGCSDCDGGLVELTLQYNGPAAATITVEDSKDTYFDNTIEPGESFTFNGTKKDGKFRKNDLDLFVDAVLHTEINVSCAQPVNPGLDFGDFTIIEAISRKGGPVCAFDPNACDTCKGGVTSLTLEYNGDIAATIIVEDGVEIYFSGLVQPEETLTVNGTRADGKFQENALDVLVGGVLHTTIDVTCGLPVNPGLDYGDFTIAAATSKDHGAVCPTGTDGGGDFVALCHATDACDTDPTTMSLLLIPDLPGATIEFKVKGKKKLKFELDKNKIKVEGPDPETFWAEVQAAGGIVIPNGERFDLDLKPGSDKYEFKYDAFQSLEKVKGPEVVLRCRAEDASGNEAEVEVSPECSTCKGGVTSLTLQYNGVAAATVTVQDQKATYFSETLNPGEHFSFSGTKADGKFEKNDLDVFVAGGLDAEINVSCAQAINPGLDFGSFTVVEAISKNNGLVCPLGGANSLVSAGGLFAPETAVLALSSPKISEYG